MDVNHISSNPSKSNDFTFAGVDDNFDTCFKHELLMELQNRNINAGMTQHLDETIRSVILELDCRFGHQRRLALDNGIANIAVKDQAPISDQSSGSSESGGRDVKKPEPNKGNIATLSAVIDMAYTGDTGGLRKVSWYQPNYLRQLKIFYADCTSGSVSSHYHPILWNETVDGTDDLHIHAKSWTTILLVAIIGGHARTIHWLITEAGCNLNDTDSCGRTVFDISKQQHEITQGCSTRNERQHKNLEIQELLQRLQSVSTNCK